ncbi:glycine cleavage system protein GcvH [Actinophytocola algeriensis]|uniref:Glycine cleavage system H protein n=1 Tax=Actinophytocola algeriensis TaxID=1768010 RepID=A0A7W7QF87_9PSEU|nr:glycine cleavage system protein GcvH [Actinophytocola algeriensis]MBB4912438.1 glycine cleavage system H protein [Actinophytocola algeriensis]MBE1480989.1 glycine cleavage system H protein [Actinophytocola algeriensis]
MTPEDLKYTEEHEWLAKTEGSTVRVGITDYAQDQLGDVVFVELPKVGEKVDAGSPLGEVESTKSVSEIFAPVSGEVTAVNNALDESPELINSDPYGEGWIVEITATDIAALDDLMDAAAYQALTDK